jgi:RNA polymerase sigma-70 factor (ECF subfamily)
MSQARRTRTVGATTSRDEFHRTEDPDAGVLHGRFRRARQLRDDPDRERQVSLAVIGAREGDREALRYLYVQYADNVYGYVASLLRDEHDAEDVTQQVFAKLMVVLPRYEERGVPFSAWILRVAHNAAVDAIRQRRAVPYDEVRETHHFESDAEDRVLSIKEALGALPEDQREVVVLRHMLGLSPREIAEKLGKTEPSVHGLHHRGRGALKAALIERGSGPAVPA